MYYLSVCAIFKNEAHIIDEWISHYLDEGVDHFYLIDNGSTDCYQMKITPFGDKVTLFIDDEKYKQEHHYNKYVFPFKHETTWLMTVELDEFAYSRNGFATIAEYLHSLPPSIEAVNLLWKIFGSSKYIDQPSNVVNSFLYRKKDCSNCIGWQKQIVKTEFLSKIKNHDNNRSMTICSDNELMVRSVTLNFMSPIETERVLEKANVHLNHYQVQSYNWFKSVKCKRGDVYLADLNNIRNEAYFQSYDFNEVFDDELYLKKNPIPQQFEIGVYRQYPDLTHFIGRELIDHYLTYGQFENRKTSRLLPTTDGIFKSTQPDLKCNLGNTFCVYFTKMGFAFMHGTDFHHKPFTQDVLKNLPSTVAFVSDDENMQRLKNLCGSDFFAATNWTGLNGFWELNVDTRYMFWSLLKPKINRMLTDLFSQNNLVKSVSHPVIHFRCSDVPFIRHPVYHFQKYSFFTDSLSELKQKGVDTTVVYLMYYLHHHNNHHSECKVYLNSLKRNIETNGHKVVLVNTMSSLDDLSILFHAPAVISTCSSFSFFGGFFSDGLFITEGHYNEDMQLQNSCSGECLRKGYSLNHKDVVDYTDTVTVIKQLS